MLLIVVIVVVAIVALVAGVVVVVSWLWSSVVVAVVIVVVFCRHLHYVVVTSGCVWIVLLHIVSIFLSFSHFVLASFCLRAGSLCPPLEGEPDWFSMLESFAILHFWILLLIPIDNDSIFAER